MEDESVNNEQEQSLEEQYKELDDTIKSELVRFNKKTIDFAKRNAKGESIPVEETKLHVEHQKLISQLERSRKQIFQMLYPKGKKVDDKLEQSDKGSLGIVKEMPHTIKPIVGKISSS